MAPIENKPDHNAVEKQLKEVIQSLYQVMVQVSSYDTQGGRPTRDVLAAELGSLSRSLQAVHRTAAPAPAPAPGGGAPAPAPLPAIPQELIQYVENGRNPDIYTREFVELVRRGNQLVRGKMRAFAGFRDVLAGEMAAALPELRADVARVVEATGGPLEDGFAAGPGPGLGGPPEGI